MNAPDRAAWLAQRRKGLGGSDIAAVMGLSPWRSPLDVYLDKVGEAQPDETNEAQYWGLTLEDVVAREYAARTGRKVQRVNAVLQHPEHPWMLGSIDRAIVAYGSRARLDATGRLAGAEAVLECKTVSAYAAGDWQGLDGSDALPVYYAAQAMWYLAITGLPWCDVPALIGGQRFVVRRVERDDETIRGMVEQAEAFWRGHVLAQQPPPPRTGAEAAKLFGRDTGEMVEIGHSAELVRVVDELRAVRQQLQALEHAEDRLRDQLQLAIGPAAGLAVNGQPAVTWKAAKDSTVTDFKAAAAALLTAEQLAPFTTTKPGSRRFIVRT